MNGQDPMWLYDCDEKVEQCEDCPHPNGCIQECVIALYTSETIQEDTNVR